MINPVTASLLSGAPYIFSAGDSTRTTVPVRPANYIYAHFKHVSGIPAPDGVQGAAVTKLKILDTLIERLSQLRKNQAIASQFTDSDVSSEEQIDALIEELRKQMKTAQAASTVMPYAPSAAVPAGSFVSASA
ncbi:MAG: hypothetical protein LBD22_01475 [Spirochaetaceae bacterium]|nr:hypothetical protein [Spirochaetaceae bacterium]